MFPLTRRLLLPLALALLPVSLHAQQSIGTAMLQQDGTLILRLRAQGPGGERGESVLRYPAGHPERDALLRHVGGLQPGQTKPFPPMADPRPPAPR